MTHSRLSATAEAVSCTWMRCHTIVTRCDPKMITILFFPLVEPHSGARGGVHRLHNDREPHAGISSTTPVFTYLNLYFENCTPYVHIDDLPSDFHDYSVGPVTSEYGHCQSCTVFAVNLCINCSARRIGYKS